MRETRHEGNNLKRIRELLGVKQEALALTLGNGWSQRKISQLEAKAVIGDKYLEPIAEALNLPSSVIRNFDIVSAIQMLHYISEECTSEAKKACDCLICERLTKALLFNQRLYERLAISFDDH